MKAPLRIGIAGLGTVGAGVVKLLAEHGRLLSLRGGRSLKLVAVSARRKAKKPRSSMPEGIAGRPVSTCRAPRAVSLQPPCAR